MPTADTVSLVNHGRESDVMRIFVTGGTGIVGTSAVTELVRRGCTVRLFSRNATTDAELWPHGVESRDGDIAQADTLRGAMNGCDVVVHMAAVVAERPPETTFQAVNVDGTRHVVAEAERAGIQRLIYVSSLGADTGQSGYHVSKRAGEEIVRSFSRDWTIVRPGNVYGGGDQIISLMLTILRSLPIIPVINGGHQPFQPVWVEDFAESLAQLVHRPDFNQAAIDLSGPDQTCMNDLIDRMERITGRSIFRVPMTGAVACTLSRLGARVGLTPPITRDQVVMLEEGSVIGNPADNAIATLLNRRATNLADGLAKAADSLPEQLPTEGVGRMQHRHVWTDIPVHDSAENAAEEIFQWFRHRFSDITPWHMDLHAEPDTTCEIRAGATLTMSLPIRGNVQVRVEQLSTTDVTLVTLEGHPLAGAVHFSCTPTSPQVVRFDVNVYDRASTFLDWLAMSTVGGFIQLRTWKSIVRRVAEDKGGPNPAVHHRSSSLDHHRSKDIERWLNQLVVARKRRENGARCQRADMQKCPVQAPQTAA